MSKPKLLLIGYVWPEPSSSAAGVRTWDLIRIFRKKGWEIHFVSPSKENQFEKDLKDQGIQTRNCEANDSSFDSYVSQLAPECVIFDRFVIEEQFGWRVKDHSPKSVRILDTQDLHFLRRAREQALSEGCSQEQVNQADIPLLGDDAFREVAAVYRSDLSLLISSFEFDLLKERFEVPARLIHLLGFLHEETVSPQTPSHAEREGFCWVGNFRHPPNADAVQWMARSLWPKIRKQLPQASLHVYGAYPSKEASAFHDPKQGFLVHGWTEDVRKTLARHRVNLAPLRFGAGIKGKIVEGWLSGTPVVATPIAAEGLTGSESSWGGSVADTEDGLVGQAVILYQREDSWRKAQGRGLELVRELFSEGRLSGEFFKQVDQILADREAHRSKNFVGNLLWYHQFRSTTYFSKWIELKNQLKDR